MFSGHNRICSTRDWKKEKINYSRLGKYLLSMHFVNKSHLPTGPSTNGETKTDRFLKYFI